MVGLTVLHSCAPVARQALYHPAQLGAMLARVAGELCLVAP